MIRWSRWFIFAFGGKLRKTPLEEKITNPILTGLQRQYVYTYPFGDSARSARDLKTRTGGSTPVMEYGVGTPQPDLSAQVVRSTGSCSNAPKVH